MTIERIREASYLWLPNSSNTDSGSIQRLLACNSALDRMLVGDLEINDFLDIVESSGVNIEEYEKTVEENLFLLGL